MSARDRLVLLVLGAVAVLGAVWVLAVSPARKQATAASGEVASARSQLAQAQAEALEARTSRSRYRAAYASLANLGMAVPTTQEVPSLMYALDHAANHHKVQFTSITNGSAGSSSSSSGSGSSSSASATPTADAFTQMPFTLTFTGGYRDLIRLLTNLEGFTVQSSGGALHVSGRLLTIQSIQLGSPSGSSGTPADAAAAPANQMTWTISASGYVLPSSAGAGAAGPSGPATPAPAGGATPAATPAVVRVEG